MIGNSARQEVPMIAGILILLGLCLGSFVNALVWRLHKQERASSTEQRAQYSISKGRSMCVHCRHELAWHDLLPVVSWLSLGGKCRYCHKPISWQYPVVELATACLFVFSYLFWPYTLHSSYSLLLFVFWLVFLAGFMALIVYDLRWMLLPDRIVRPLQAIAAAYVLIQAVAPGGGWHTLQGAALGVVFSAGVFYLLYQVSGGRWIGGGDVKLAVVLGLLLASPMRALLMIFIASLLGSLVSVPLLLRGKVRHTTRLPFGPLLIIATMLVYLFGTAMIGWYEKQLLLV